VAELGRGPLSWDARSGLDGARGVERVLVERDRVRGVIDLFDRQEHTESLPIRDLLASARAFSDLSHDFLNQLKDSLFSI
jgi:hypothetical protein